MGVPEQLPWWHHHEAGPGDASEQNEQVTQSWPAPRATRPVLAWLRGVPQDAEHLTYSRNLFFYLSFFPVMTHVSCLSAPLFRGLSS